VDSASRREATDTSAGPVLASLAFLTTFLTLVLLILLRSLRTSLCLFLFKADLRFAKRFSFKKRPKKTNSYNKKNYQKTRAKQTLTFSRNFSLALALLVAL
jgi:hypothetical protein